MTDRTSVLHAALAALTVIAVAVCITVAAVANIDTNGRLRSECIKAHGSWVDGECRFTTTTTTVDR